MKNTAILKSFLACMLGVTATAANAQVDPVYNVPSPTAANIGTYGSVPVGLFTGVPDISIPLHEIAVGSMKFPITLSYHLASVKPNQYPGPVGLGWSLQCGGCITRTVRGVPDEKMSGTHENGYYGNRSKMNGISTNQFDNLTAKFSNTDDSGWFELSADEFSFNFFGHSGNFYLNPEGGWTVVSDEDIKVEFDEKDGFFNILDLDGRIPNVANWPNKDNNMRHFKEFTLITPDGCRFTFGGLYATDFSVPYYSRKTGDLVATSWHLSSIETPDRRKVTYKYADSTGDLMVDIRYSPSSCSTTGFPASGKGGTNIGRSGFTGFLLFPARLAEITTQNETISLEYKADWRYQTAYADNNAGEALYWSGDGFSRKSLYQFFDSSPSAQFTFLFPSFNKDSDAAVRSSIAGRLRASVLYGIQINRHGDAKTILFEYLEGSRRKLQRIAWRSGLVNISTSFIQGGGVMYPFYSIPKNTSETDMPEYKFSYNPGSMPEGYILPQADSWGYWNGLKHSLSGGITDAPYNLKATMAETLTSITYPTGGKTVFEYEGNDYSKKENTFHQVEAAYGVSGGLRVRRITNITRENKIVSSKVYHYGETISASSQSSGVARLKNPLSVVYETSMSNYEWRPMLGSAGPYNVSMRISGMYGFGEVITNLNSPDVGYSCVIEETVDPDGKSLGYVVNRFSNYGTDIQGNTHNDEPAWHSYNISGSGAGLPYTSNSAERGHLLSKVWFDSYGKELKSETYRYVRINDDSMPTATQKMVYLNTDPANLVSASLAWLTNTNTYSYMMAFVKVCEGAYSDSTRIRYNSSRQVISEAAVSSTGGYKVTSYTYPSDYPQLYKWMEDAHIISPVVSSGTVFAGQSRTTRNTYSNAGTETSPVSYISKVETEFGSKDKQTDYEVLSTDFWGNPTEIVENGVHTVLQWGKFGQRLIKRVEGITLAEYEALPEKTASAKTLSSSMIVFPGMFEPDDRETSGLHAWSYTYDFSLNLLRATSPDGTYTCYDYDELGRLIKEYFYETDADGKQNLKTVKKYEYHYQKD